MRMKRLLAAAPALAAQAFYAIGHAVVGTFLTNTRIVGIRDSRIKAPLIAANVIGWAVVGLASALPARTPEAEGRRLNEITGRVGTTPRVRLGSRPAEFDGFTIAQVSDIHFGDFTS